MPKPSKSGKSKLWLIKRSDGVVSYREAGERNVRGSARKGHYKRKGSRRGVSGGWCWVGWVWRLSGIKGGGGRKNLLVRLHDRII